MTFDQRRAFIDRRAGAGRDGRVHTPGVRCERVTLFQDVDGRVERLGCNAAATEAVLVGGAPVACCARCAQAFRDSMRPPAASDEANVPPVSPGRATDA